jgi:hypothetical protein
MVRALGEVSALPWPAVSPGRGPESRQSPCCGRQQQHGRRIKQKRYCKDEQAQHNVVADAEQGRKIFNGAKVRLDLPTYAIDLGST